MARNEPTSYGRDIRCVRDADALFTEAVGVEVVQQDAIHRLTTDNILGDDGTGSLIIEGWGFDVRRLLGLATPRLKAHQPILAEVLLRDPRIDTADVRLEATRAANGLDDILLTIRCETALGPFELVRPVSELTADDLVGQP